MCPDYKNILIEDDIVKLQYQIETSTLYEHVICGHCGVPSVCRKFVLLNTKTELLHIK